MGRTDYRGGQAPIRTASELAVILPVPLLMIVHGYATVVFPRTDRSNQSPEVAVVSVRSKKTYPPPVALPLFIHWKQWEEIVVPLLEDDDRVTGWRGVLKDLGEAVILMNDIVGPDGEIAFQEDTQIGLSVPVRLSLGTLFACDPYDAARFGGRTGSYLNALAGVIYEKAVSEGY